MKRTIILWGVLCFVMSLWAVPGGYFNVKDFGAKGDGVHTDSPAINAAIQAASEAGGGTVYFPAGTYSSYSIRLQNHISLYLDHGAILKAAVPNEKEHYDLPEENWSTYHNSRNSHH